MEEIKVNKKYGMYFKFEYSQKEYDILLKRFKGDIRKLNKFKRKILMQFIEENKKSSFGKIRKEIYLPDIESDKVIQFCNKKNISRATLSEYIKQATLTNPI